MLDIKILILLLALSVAFMPVVFWFYILKKKKEDTVHSRYVLTFVISGLGAISLFYYNSYIIEGLFDFGVGYLAIFIILGVAIEYYKNLIVRICGMSFFKNINDVIDLSFAAALGFTFFDNVIHFYIIFEGQNLDLISANSAELIGPVKILKYVLVREFFVLPIHLICSGLFGYYYGIGLFATDDYQKSQKKGVFYLLIFIFLKLIRLSDLRIFRTIKIIQGTLISVTFYALFFTMVQYDFLLSDVMRILGADWFFTACEQVEKCLTTPKIDERLLPLIAYGFFYVGTVVFFMFMDQKKRLIDKKFLKTNE